MPRPGAGPRRTSPWRHPRVRDRHVRRCPLPVACPGHARVGRRPPAGGRPPRERGTGTDQRPVPGAGRRDGVLRPPLRVRLLRPALADPAGREHHGGHRLHLRRHLPEVRVHPRLPRPAVPDLRGRRRTRTRRRLRTSGRAAGGPDRRCAGRVQPGRRAVPGTAGGRRALAPPGGANLLQRRDAVGPCADARPHAGRGPAGLGQRAAVHQAQRPVRPEPLAVVLRGRASGRAGVQPVRGGPVPPAGGLGPQGPPPYRQQMHRTLRRVAGAGAR